MYSMFFCAASRLGIDMPNTRVPFSMSIGPDHSGPLDCIDHAAVFLLGLARRRLSAFEPSWRHHAPATS